MLDAAVSRSPFAGHNAATRRARAPRFVAVLEDRQPPPEAQRGPERNGEHDLPARFRDNLAARGRHRVEAA